MRNSRYLVERPEDFLFNDLYTARQEDAPGGHHIAAYCYLGIATRSKNKFMTQLGFVDTPEFGTVGSIMANSQADYLGEGRVGELLQIAITVQNIQSKSFDWIYCIGNADSGREIARISARILTFDYKLGKVVEVPKIFTEKIGVSR